MALARRPSMIIWSSTTNSATSRKPTAASGTARKTSSGTSSRSATTSKGRWANSPTTSTTKSSDATCSCGTTRWARTVMCSAASDLFPPSFKGRPPGRLFLYIKRARSQRHSPRPLFPFLSVGIET